MSLPVHGWYRFPAGFSAKWARSVIDKHRESTDRLALLDPFAGVGTTVLSGEDAGVKAYGVEAQPFIQKIAAAKLLWHTDTVAFRDAAQAVVGQASGRSPRRYLYPKLIHGCFGEEALSDLNNLRHTWEEMDDGGPVAKLTWLALVGILRSCSSAGTAPWQYVLPSKTKSKVLAPYDAFNLQVRKMLADMTLWQMTDVRCDANIFLDDARLLNTIADDSVGLVITSPPYANNYDYGDATRLEMSFFGEVTGWGDLHEKARKHLIRSCSQHASIEKLDLNRLLDELVGTTLVGEISSVCDALAEQRLYHGGKKDYHLMVAAYFADMRKAWRSLRRVCASGARACFVVGDSAPYGVYVPTDRWLGELALDAGFRDYSFEKIRDRNVKWKNRKHDVPLKEGFLWVQG
ncbi:MAG: site-specific DNA-methyltransferase [Dehalococcoidia bacterium]|nr:site-specific DNA-methyltransferase [Dehalococcoidia bacterium]